MNSSWAPIESSGTSTTSRADGPKRAPARTRRRISGIRRRLARKRAASAAPSSRLSVRSTSWVTRVRRRLSRAACGRGRSVLPRAPCRAMSLAVTSRRMITTAAPSATAIRRRRASSRASSKAVAVADARVRLVVRELLGRRRHRLEPTQLGPEQDPLRRLGTIRLQFAPGHLVELHEAFELLVQPAEQSACSRWSVSSSPASSSSRRSSAAEATNRSRRSPPA